MKIFALSGLGADDRVFKFLELEHELIPVLWLEPSSKESIIDYSKRLIVEYGIDKEEHFGILGVSFGGLVAVEMSKILNPKFTVLISSVERKNELRSFFKLPGSVFFLKLLPKWMFMPPKPIARFLFGAENKELLYSILDDTNLTFAKWAVLELVSWKNTNKLENLIKIGGSKDRILPPTGKNGIIIDGGGHFMIVDKANQVSKIINREI